ncbi:2-amino-4-hydroxy-6-hydroxymethyldihydropteridine diphosphokinase [[Limnothrix rosea] IAM M-220]|uniref:2-amino-4-hydroxy-6- hydroxymethyldihydropteridine diphosphokinase n=1 Tax=[Limnothrix rosea] IAM M-220 TaxID=454133 RepID=UPI0009646E76|nr:2-amino-4-hydroxy-6-hydroxymethyldihydropteridine diphosphokinase [[Limnothrix rosea] IAM M-220]OKH19417.1 2-amino-4-hydroxy-6-hydroxymethyldihydropteridine diphosphokinase [[Limnothrix rosea] IAM M-220]
MARHRVYLSVASNIQPEGNIFAAMEQLMDYCRILAVSRCFVTDAIPAPDQPPSKELPYYINCVALVETDLEAESLKFEVLRGIEAKLGRVRTADKYAPRPIDLDILLFNHDVIQQDNLQIPDPDLRKRWFLAQGVVDIAPDLILPDTSQLLQQVLEPLLERFYATEKGFREDDVLRAKILAIAA